MRIGIEVTGTQSDSRHRGVGRYIKEFVHAIFKLGSSHEFVIYAEAGAPSECLPDAPIELLAPIAEWGERDMTGALRRVLNTNSDDLDLMLVTNPLELRPDMLTPERPLNGLKMASFVHDLIPLLYCEHYYTVWPGQEFVRRYLRGLDRIRSYDLLLAVSEATRKDVIQHLGVASNKVSTIMAASDSPCWTPGSLETAKQDRATLSSLDIDRPFVFSMGAMEYRKNLWGLLDAYASLPTDQRDQRLLVLTYAMNSEEADRVRAHASARGILEQLRITGRLTDEQLATLYRRSEVFVFPSLYEGFGLPVLEAMRCGACVLTGNNSSLVEVVGDGGGMLADVASAADMGSKLRALIESPQLRDQYKRDAIREAERFSWATTAQRAIDAIESTQRTIRMDRGHRARKATPRVAYFSPFPPMLSGISDYSERLVEEMRKDHVVDLFHDENYEPSIKVRSREQGCYDHRMFRRLDAVRPYDAIVYQMGNSPLHKYLYEMLPTDPGIITLHDFNLSGFRYWDAMNLGGGVEAFRRDMQDFSPGLSVPDAATIQQWTKQPGGVAEACSMHGIFLNHRIFREGLSVVVHSPWCVRQAEAIHGALAEKATVIPFGATALYRTPEELAALRSKYGIPLDAYVIGNFGLIHSTKMNVESLVAFAEVAKERADALFILVGPEYDDNASRQAVAELGLEARVRFLGPKRAADFVELTAIADLGINLRRPPTNGETSAALMDLVRQGVATIVTNVGSFSDYPDHAVRKVYWDQEGQAGLTAQVLRLSRNTGERLALGESARQYIAEHHSWSNAASMYAELIARHGRGHARTVGRSVYRGPHRRLNSTLKHQHDEVA